MLPNGDDVILTPFNRLRHRPRPVGGLLPSVTTYAEPCSCSVLPSVAMATDPPQSKVSLAALCVDSDLLVEYFFYEQ